MAIIYIFKVPLDLLVGPGFGVVALGSADAHLGRDRRAGEEARSTGLKNNAMLRILAQGLQRRQREWEGRSRVQEV